jgi:arylformamidase
VSDWKQLDQDALERGYNARATVPDVDAELRAYRTESTPMYQLPCARSVRYGPGADETLDIFPVPGRPDAPLFVFIHGGYWRALAKEDSVFMARNFTALGIAVAAVDYSLAPGAGLHQMVDQCRRATAWLHLHGETQRVQARRMLVAGSSAGAHLAAMVLAGGWQQGLGVSADLVFGGVLVSGLFDLEPVQKTLPNSWLGLDLAQALALSPQHQLPDPARALHIVVAERDTSEFKRQSRDYADACQAQGNTTLFYEVPARNHFNVLFEWTDPDSALTRSVLSLLG